MISVLPANSKSILEHPLSTKLIFHEPTVQVSKQKMSLTLPVQKSYSVQVKKKQLFDILDDISEARTITALKLTRISKETETVFGPSKKITEPVITSLFFNPFKFKERQYGETKNVGQPSTQKKDKFSKGPRQSLTLYHQQQLCKDHQPTIYPSVYP